MEEAQREDYVHNLFYPENQIGSMESEDGSGTWDILL